jgi:mRNA-degrading endonuclease RelE of RelBE toxin-antitoxin system
MNQATSKAASSSKPYALEMTASAEAVYQDLYRRSREAEERGDPTNSHCTTFKMVRDTIKHVIQVNPLDKRYALAGDLSNIFRVKKGRLRICWIAASKTRTIVILFISETLRKEGDINDPYRVFANMVMSGQFDNFFSRLGVRIPRKQS